MSIVKPPVFAFSNHWKNQSSFFQSLEKKQGRVFQPLEKFPMVGKLPEGYFERAEAVTGDR
jgi:hypothetical protein